MSRIVAVALMFCVMLASPALGTWIYDGTGAEISDPFYWEALDGTCGCGWNSSGCTVDGDEHNLSASGETWGEAWAWLTPDYGLSRDVWAASHVHGWSNYEWAGGDTYVEGAFSGEISGSLNFSGDCLDRTGTCDASASSSCSSMGDLSTPFRSATAEGACYGWAWSTGGTYAFTDPGNTTPTTDYADYDDILDYWGDPMGGWYEGALYFTGTLSGSFNGVVGYPWFSIEAEVYGGSDASGELVINDPNFYWGGFDASANYYSSGYSYVYVTW